MQRLTTLIQGISASPRSKAVLYAFAIALSTAMLMKLTVLQKAEELSIDYRFQQWTRPDLADSNVVIIAIDNQSLDYFAESGLPWPWSRDTHAFMLDVLHNAGVRAVLMDLLFYDADVDRFEIDTRFSDATFARRLEDYPNVVIAAELLPTTSADVLVGPNFSLGVAPSGISSPFSGVRLPFPAFSSATSHIGASNVQPDPGGIIRRTWYGFNVGGQFLPSLALRTLHAAGVTVRTNETQISVGDHTFTQTGDGSRRIFWYGPPGPDGVFRYVSFAGVLSEGMNNPENLAFLKDKIVVIGAYAAGLLDYKPTPLSAAEPYPGMEIWATVLSNLMQGHQLSTPSSAVTLLILLLIAYLTMRGFVTLRQRSFTIILAGSIAAYLLLTALAWHEMLLALPVVPPLLALITAYTLVAVQSYLREGQSRQQLRTLFNRYLHPDVIDQLTEQPDRIALGGHQYHASILFTDIANFTTHAEKHTPAELVTELNRYLTVVTNFVLEEDGLLDKFTGDGIMALFGVPLQCDDHAIRACTMAVRHRRFTHELAVRGDDPNLLFFHENTRIGINSGDLIAGNIGSDRRMDFTAIGDDVNLAARLEGANKEYDTHIMIGENTRALIGDRFICRELDSITVKGKTRPLRIFELVDFAPAEGALAGIATQRTKKVPIGAPHSTTEGDYSWITRYEAALSQYRKGDFSDAGNQFSLLHQEMGDMASQIMARRCNLLTQNPPDHWDGVFNMKTK
jgi:adenylate cyclase